MSTAPEVTPAVLADVFRDAGVSADPTAATSLRSGANSDVFEVPVPGSAPVVVKLYSDDLAWKREKEVFVYGLLASVPAVPVPDVVRSGVLDDARSTNYLVLSKVEGRLAADVVPELTPARVQGLYEELGAIMAAIHTVTFDAYGYLTTTVLDPHPTNDAYMRFQFDKKLREFDGFNGPPELRARVERFVGERDEVFGRCERAVLCHDDLHEGNVVLAEGGTAPFVSGILDVENAVAADPLIDVAKTLYYAVRDDPDKRRGLFAGYGQLPDGWEEALDVYVVYHVLELWDWFALNGDDELAASVLRDLDRLTSASV